MKAKVFLSYSKTKSADLQTTNRLISVFGAIFARHNIIKIDPMIPKAHEYSEISQDVVNSIYESDCVFVLEFPPVLNTAYESGLAFSLGIPVYHWLPEKPLQAETDSNLAKYLEYLGYSGGVITLPADQGDRRFYTFPNDIATNAYSEELFSQSIEKFLADLKKGPLNPAAIRARRQFRRLAERVNELAKRYVNDAPMCWVMESLLSQVYDYFSKHGYERFIIDESIYRSFLRALDANPDAAAAVIAVADLTSGIEKFWENTRAGGRIGERIFRIAPLDFFDQNRLNTILRSARDLSQSYPVYLTDMDPVDSQQARARFGVSGDFVVYNDLVGDYVEDREESTKKLRMEKNRNRSENLKSYFSKTKDLSVAVNSTSTPIGVKKEWMKLRRIGEWREEWRGGHERSNEYYEAYDQHIRAWIPYYDELTSKVAGKIIECLSSSDLLRNSYVGEIGCGTGTLTRLIARWSDSLYHAGVAGLNKYVYVDVAREMLDKTQSVIHKYNDANLFVEEQNYDFQGLRARLGPDGGYGLICGSLILHYIGRDVFNIKTAMAELDMLLIDRGVAVFGGCFFDENEAQRSSEIEWWMNWMIYNGLSEEVASRFISCNNEMTSMPSAREISESVSSQFDTEYFAVHEQRSPFGVLLLRKKASTTP